jgi:hypothetical protein
MTHWQSGMATMSQLLSESHGERRRSLRQRRLNGAKIVFNNNCSVIECVVCDLSLQGARLRVATPIGIPNCFELRMDRSGACYPAKVAWRSRDQIGVAFFDRSPHAD